MKIHACNNILISNVLNQRQMISDLTGITKKNAMLSIDIYLKDRSIKTDSFQMNLNI